MPCEIGRNEDKSGRSYRNFERRNTLQIPRSIREHTPGRQPNTG